MLTLQDITDNTDADFNEFVALLLEADERKRITDEQSIALGYIASDHLIDNYGKPNLPVMHDLKKYCIKVRPEEVDSFGWLTGVIYLPSGKTIVYG